MQETIKSLPGWLIPTGIILCIVLIIYGSFTGAYNTLISQREEAITRQADIESSMQRRADLVPNVVGATKGAMKQEQAVFDSISKAYANFNRAPSGSQEKVTAGDQLGAALRGYLVVAQQYPELKSLNQIKDLTTILEGTENRINRDRSLYNEAVRKYNVSIQKFPTNLIAGLLGFERMKPFEASNEGKKNPSVEL